MSVARLIRDACRRHAPRTALVRVDVHDPDTILEAWTYRRLFEALRSFSAGLLAFGMRAGERLAVLAPNSVELVLTEWACLLNGFVWVALNARSSTEEQEEILRDCLPRLLVVGESLKERGDSLHLPPGCARIATDSEEWTRLLATPAEGFEPRDPNPQAAVRIRYTSGTSGRAKGAVLTSACYQASVEAVSGVLEPIRPGDTLVQVAPMTHASGAMLLPHVAVGARALLLDRFEVESFTRIVERHHGTSVFLVPTMLVRLLESPHLERLSTLRTIVYGGAAMPVDRIEKGIEALGQVFVQIYGLTESTWPVTALLRDEHPLDPSAPGRRARLASCGRPTAVGEVRVVRADGSEAAAGEPGEILVRGRNTMIGYWRGEHEKPALHLDCQQPPVPGRPGGGPRSGPGRSGPPAFKGLDADGWMHTGDVGVRDDQGFLTIIDRMHDMIVSGGFNVYPVEVERALSTHPAVLESAVVGLPDPEWGERVHAAVVLRGGAEASAEDLVSHCSRLIAGFKKPRSVEFVGELPRNASDKILRREVRERLLASRRAAKQNAPRR